MILIERSAEIKRAHESGRTLRELADEYGLTYQRIQQITSEKPQPRKQHQHYIYPNIRAWLFENGCTVKELAELCGVSTACLSQFLRGNTRSSKYLIDRLLDVTGMKYEEAFYKEEGEK